MTDIEGGSCEEAVPEGPSTTVPIQPEIAWYWQLLIVLGCFCAVCYGIVIPLTTPPKDKIPPAGEMLRLFLLTLAQTAILSAIVGSAVLLYAWHERVSPRTRYCVLVGFSVTVIIVRIVLSRIMTCSVCTLL